MLGDGLAVVAAADCICSALADIGTSVEGGALKTVGGGRSIGRQIWKKTGRVEEGEG